MFTLAPTMIDAPFKTTLFPVRAHGVVYLTKQYLSLQEVYIVETTVTGRSQSGGRKVKFDSILKYDFESTHGINNCEHSINTMQA
jgi:hypothetical protein